MTSPPGILFTAFEPSGDEHAAPVIHHLRQTLPDVPIWALGGPRMAAAGAQIIEQTTGGAAMLAGAFGKVREQLAVRRRLKQWLDAHPVAIHVPTDSPAANWAICKMVKRRWAGEPGLGQVVHLVAPQVWAWAQWRVRRLQKWSDLVLCLLPFEVDWFAKHEVATRFIGHPLFDEKIDAEHLDWQAVSYPAARPRIALLPGSRGGEVTANLPIMLETYKQLKRRHPAMVGLIAAADEATTQQIARLAPDLPRDVRVVTSQTDAVLRWSDAVFTASGTATLHIARQFKPMVILYRVSPMSWHLLGRWLIDTRTFTLPNLIAAGGPHRDPERHIVREFVPFLGDVRDVAPIVAELDSLLTQPGRREKQVAALKQQVVQQFAGHDAGREAAEAIQAVFSNSSPDEVHTPLG